VSDDDLKPVLHSGENVVAQGPADLSVPPLPMPDSPPALLGGLLVRAWRSLRPEDPVEAASLIADSRGTAFPLERHMVLVLTSERILTWGIRTRLARPHTLLADVPLWQIKTVTTGLPASGTKQGHPNHDARWGNSCYPRPDLSRRCPQKSVPAAPMTPNAESALSTNHGWSPRARTQIREFRACSRLGDRRHIPPGVPAMATIHLSGRGA
jgi:hypothetical protein